MRWVVIIAAPLLYLVGGLLTVIVFAGFGFAVFAAYSLGRESREDDVLVAYNRGFADANAAWRKAGSFGRREPPKTRPQRTPRQKIPTHWKTLGLRPGATKDAVVAAYRKLAMRWHPDHGGSDAKMQELNRAREAALKETT